METSGLSVLVLPLLVHPGQHMQFILLATARDAEAAGI